MMRQLNTVKKDYFWNTVGSGIYALSSMFLAFVAMQLAGPEEGGVFGFGFSTFGQQMFIIAYFGIRPFHITDSSYEYSYDNYRSLRRITSFSAAAAAAAYLLLMYAAGSYSLHKALIVFLLALYKISDGIADLYESECQRCGVLWIGGKELALRTVLASVVLIVVMALSRNVFAACTAAVLVQYGCIIGFKLYTEKHVFHTAASANAAKSSATVAEADMAAAGKACAAGEEKGSAAEINSGFNTEKQTAEIRNVRPVRRLAGSTVLLFLSVFVDFYIFSAAKYAIDSLLTDADSGVFNILFMPTSVIYLAANFIIKPYMTRLSAVYEAGDHSEFSAVLRKLKYGVLLLSALALAGAALLGKPVLMLLEYLLGSGYEGVFSSKWLIFVLIILGGCFYALSNLYYYILIIMRRQKLIFEIYCAVAVIAFILSRLAVQHFGLMGAAAVYPCYMLAGTLCFALSCRHELNLWKKS